MVAAIKKREAVDEEEAKAFQGRKINEFSTAKQRSVRGEREAESSTCLHHDAGGEAEAEEMGATLG